MEIKKYFKDNWKIFLDSIKDFDKRTVLIILYDLIFFTILYLTLTKFFVESYLERMNFKLGILDIGNAIELPTNQAEAANINLVLSELKGVLFGTIGVILLIFLIIFLSMCILKILIWFTTAKKKFTKKDILNFIKIRATWLLISLGVTLILTPLFITIGVAAKMSWVVVVNVVFMILTLIGLFLTNVKNLMYIYYTETKDMGCIKKAFKTGFKKVHFFILPYFVIILLLLLISTIISIFTFIPPTLLSLIMLLIILTYTAWSRIYLYHFVKNLDKL